MKKGYFGKLFVLAWALGMMIVSGFAMSSYSDGGHTTPGSIVLLVICMLAVGAWLWTSTIYPLMEENEKLKTDIRVLDTANVHLSLDLKFRNDELETKTAKLEEAEAALVDILEPLPKQLTEEEQDRQFDLYFGQKARTKRQELYEQEWVRAFNESYERRLAKITPPLMEETNRKEN